MDTLSQLLKVHTRRDHDATEESLRSREILTGSFSLAQYRRLIETMFIFHAKYEERIFSMAKKIIPPDFDLAARRKLPALQHDVKALDINVSTDRTSPLDLDEFNALGFLYVMEGSSLGGQVILKSISRLPDIASKNALHYYSGYGERTGTMWLEFKNVLDNIQTDERSRKQVIEGASSAFREIMLLHSQEH